jgi:hypothetical protein
MKIYKYEIERHGISYLGLCEGATVISAGMQDGQMYIWVITDVKRITAREFLTVYTGEELPEKLLQFIATVHDHTGLVYHIFEIK